LPAKPHRRYRTRSKGGPGLPEAKAKNRKIKLNEITMKKFLFTQGGVGPKRDVAQRKRGDDLAKLGSCSREGGSGKEGGVKRS